MGEEINGGGFSAHASDTIILRLVNLTRLPSPLSQPTLPQIAMGTARGMEGGCRHVIGPRGHAQANDSTGAALKTCINKSQSFFIPSTNMYIVYLKLYQNLSYFFFIIAIVRFFIKCICIMKQLLMGVPLQMLKNLVFFLLFHYFT